jgi:predicted nucleic acid-binding protein
LIVFPNRRTKLSLVDTSAWILALRKQPVPTIKERIDLLLADNCVVTVGIIQIELVGGTKSEGGFRRVKSWLGALEQVETDTSLWEAAYDLTSTVRRSGGTVPYTRIVGAAIAFKAGATAIHIDTHFDLMASPLGLKVKGLIGLAKSAYNDRG